MNSLGASRFGNDVLVIVDFPFESGRLILQAIAAGPGRASPSWLCALTYIRRNGFALQRQPSHTYCQEITMMKKTIVAAILAASFGSIATPASADIIVRIAPPELRMEVAPPPRHGHVWVAGYWDWRNNRHQWIAGNWIRERPGYLYNQPNWVERDGRWHMQRGNWRRGDRDGDGVPDRRDRAPNNPNRS
jgi:hypothetical protein